MKIISILWNLPRSQSIRLWKMLQLFTFYDIHCNGCDVYLMWFSFAMIFLKMIYFNWRPTTLQYSGSFCHTLTWISHRCTCVPLSWTPLLPPSPSRSSGLSQCTGFECPVTCIELGLVICLTYGNIHVSVLFSQIFLPLPSPTESKSLFFTSVSLLLSCI